MGRVPVDRRAKRPNEATESATNLIPYLDAPHLRAVDSRPTGKHKLEQSFALGMTNAQSVSGGSTEDEKRRVS
jgi:hypothetical protein